MLLAVCFFVLFRLCDPPPECWDLMRRSRSQKHAQSQEIDLRGFGTASQRCTDLHPLYRFEHHYRPEKVTRSLFRGDFLNPGACGVGIDQVCDGLIRLCSAGKSSDAALKAYEAQSVT